MNKDNVAVDIECEVVTLFLCQEKLGSLEAIIQRVIAHYDETWIDDTMLTARKADLQLLNRIIRHAIGARENVRIELSYPQTGDLMFALMYAANRLADDPRVNEDVRSCIEAVAADLICRIGRVQDEIRRRAHSR